MRRERLGERAGLELSIHEAQLTAMFLQKGNLGRLVGFEPTTSAATERRSATEL